MLRLLQHRFGLERLSDWRNLLCLVAHNYNGFLCTKRRARPQGVLNERSPTGSVQNLCEAGLEPRAFSGSENNDSEIVICHKREPILRELPGFRNGGLFRTIPRANQWLSQE
jgi:hypothetical protein